MDLQFLQYASIIIEMVIAILGLFIAIEKKKIYGYGLFLTFAIYVFYDFAKLSNWNINLNVLYFSFFVATLSALFAVWKIFKKL